MTTAFRLTSLMFVVFVFFMAACESTEEAIAPSIVVIESGNGQYSKMGTELPQRLVVRVQYPDMTDAAKVAVRFRTVEGGGTVSPSTGETDGRGIVSASYTLGASTGPNRIRAELVDDDTKYVVFDAVASEFYCPEEDPTFDRKFFNRGSGVYNDLFLFTRESSVNTSGGEKVAGVVRLMIDGVNVQTESVTKYEDDFNLIVTRDATFAHSGDFYLSRMADGPEVAKVNPDGNTTSHFATLETYDGGEITTSVAGVLIGCDEYGPFFVGCRDTVQRFDEAYYAGVSGDRANHDAVAVDTNPQNTTYEDIFFIDLSDNTLRRLPLDSLTATGPSVVVTDLTEDEANGANGMVCNTDGTVFVVVDTDDTKAILRVTPAGVKSTEYDFFDRGPDAEDAGVQNDLAIRPGGNPLLFTIDTDHGRLLLYDTLQQILVELPPVGDQESISTPDRGRYRIGLVMLP